MRSTGEEEEDSGSGGSGFGGPESDGSGSGGFGFGGPVFPAPAEAGDVVAALRVLATVDVRGLVDDECLGLFDALEVVDRLVASVRFKMLGEVSGRGLTDSRFGHVTPNEAGWRHGVDPGRVRRDVRTANTLSRLPDVAGALQGGVVSVDRVREVCRRVNDRNEHLLASIQGELLGVMRARSTWRCFVRDVGEVASYADSDGPEPPAPRNHASLTRSGDDVSATLDLHGSGAVGLDERVRAEADRLYREAVAVNEACSELVVPSRSELLAQAFINLVERGAGVDSDGGAVAPVADMTIVLEVDESTVSDLFHDGVLLPGPGTGPGSGGRVDWSRRAFDHSGDRFRHAAREWGLLGCDPVLTWIITNAGGHPVACRTGERYASPAQRRGLKARDGGCVFPGCDRPVNWCDAHHVHAHTQGGATDIANLVLLCRVHHGVVHRDGWTMTPNPDPCHENSNGTPAGTGTGDGKDDRAGYWIITSPRGTVMHTRHARGPGRRPGRPPAPAG